MRIIHPVKYIALLALTKIVPTHPRLVANHQAVILASVDDFDISIRMRALDLISAMVRPEHTIYGEFPLIYARSLLIVLNTWSNNCSPILSNPTRMRHFRLQLIP